MSLPEEMLDELLSAYLDGAVSEDERARVEQLLADDAEIAERLESLQDTIDAARAAKIEGFNLPADFAERTLQAAIEAAQQQSLPDEHPLQRAAGHASATPAAISTAIDGPVTTAKSGWHRTRWIAAAVAIAASLLVAGVALEFSVDPTPNERQTDNGLFAAADQNEGDAAAKQKRVAKPAKDLGSPSEAATIARHEAVVDGVEKDSPAMDSPDNVNPRLVEADIAPSPSANVETTGEQAKPGADQIADAGTDSMASPTVGDVEAAPGTQPSNNVEPTDEPTPLVRPLRSLLVVDVQLTEAGRASDAFVATLQQAGIRVGEERKVDAELASTVADEDEDSQAFSEEAELMLLEAPTKKLANLGDLLATNRNAFRSVRLSLVVDAPVLKAIESVRIDDPKKIQHGGQSIPLVTRQPDLFQEFGKTLVRGPFAPLDSTTSQMIGSPSPSEDGPNPMSQLLILIR